VASRSPGLVESVRDQETGILVPHGDAQALAGAIVSLLTDRPRRLRMAEAAIRWARGFTWERCYAESRIVIERAARAAGAGAHEGRDGLGYAPEAQSALIALKILLSVLLFAYVIREGLAARTMEYDRAADPGLLALAAALFLVSSLIGSWLWARLLRAQGVAIPYPKAASYYFVGALLQQFPAFEHRRGHRPHQRRSKHADRVSSVFSATLMDRLIGVVAIGFLAGHRLDHGPGPGAPPRPVRGHARGVPHGAGALREHLPSRRAPGLRAPLSHDRGPEGGARDRALMGRPPRSFARIREGAASRRC